MLSPEYLSCDAIGLCLDQRFHPYSPVMILYFTLAFLSATLMDGKWKLLLLKVGEAKVLGTLVIFLCCLSYTWELGNFLVLVPLPPTPARGNSKIGGKLKNRCTQWCVILLHSLFRGLTNGRSFLDTLNSTNAFLFVGFIYMTPIFITTFEGTLHCSESASYCRAAAKQRRELAARTRPLSSFRGYCT